MRSFVSHRFVLLVSALAALLLFCQDVQASWGDQAAASSGYNNAKRFQNLDDKRTKKKQAQMEEKARILLHRADQARLKALTKKADGILAKKTQQCRNFLNLNDQGGHHTWEDVFTKRDDSKKAFVSKKKEAEGFLAEELEHFKNLFASSKR